MVFTSEHKRFIIESYFRNGIFNNGKGMAYLFEFQQKIRNLN
jgi:hypothetical protein